MKQALDPTSSPALSACLDEYGIANAPAVELRGQLEQNGLAPRPKSLQGMLQSAYDYVKRVLRSTSIEGGIKLDAHTQMPSEISAKITLMEPTQSQTKRGYVSAEQLLRLGNQALAERELIHLLNSLRDVQVRKLEVGDSEPSGGRLFSKMLVEVGFFELRGDRQSPAFWVPFLYRDALDLVQGTAE